MPYVISSFRFGSMSALRARCLDCEWTEVALLKREKDALVGLADEHEAECPQAELLPGLLPTGRVGRAR